MDRAYSLLDIRAVNDEQRTIEGWATTPKIDRMGDIVDPMGITAAKTIPLFLYHDSRLVVGTPSLGTPTKKGVPFTATLPMILEPGALQDRVNEAWQLVKYRLIAATSIGFRALDGAVERIETGLKFLKTEVMELSLVPIPAQDEAVITSFKAMETGEISAEILDIIKSIDAQTREGADVDPETPAEPTDNAATGKTVHVVKLAPAARARAPFVINRINHLG